MRLLENDDAADDVVTYDIDLSDLDEHRKAPRVPIYARVELPWHMSKALRARDVSLTGMRALSRDGRVAHFAGERLHMRFQLPGTDAVIEATARVVSQREAGNDLDVGLVFETLTSESARNLYHFVQKRLS